MTFPVFFLPASARALCAAALFALATGHALAAAPFVDNLDGTVTDTSTGLMWDQCTLGLSGAGCTTGTSTQHSWSDAFGQAATQSASNYKGYSDWRLPSILELKSLVKGVVDPFIDTEAFPNYFATSWSGSTYVPDPARAWGINFSVGIASSLNKTDAPHVRLVRSGQSLDTFALSVDANGAGAGTVTASGLACARASNVTSGACVQQVANTTYAGQTAQSLTLTATPATGSVFTGWGDACSGTASTCTVTINAAKRVGAEFTAISTSSIVIDPAAPATLYSGLDGAGVYKSTDSGANWAAATTQPTNMRVKALVIQPGDSAKLYAATYGGGVFKSADSGVNWSACATQPTNLNLLSLTMDAAGKLYAGSEAGVFVSSDACANWTEINTGLPL